MLAEIREQGELLGRVLPRWQAEIDEKRGSFAGKNLHLVGCGDMYFAASQVEALARPLWGLSVRAWRSMDLRWIRRQLGADDLVVCASVSGRTPRTLEAALLARDAGAQVLGITDNPGSPLDDALDETLILGTTPLELLANKSYAGYRHIIAQTQTFTAVLVVELMLAATLQGKGADLAWIPDRVRRLVGVLDAAGARAGGGVPRRRRAGGGAGQRSTLAHGLLRSRQDARVRRTGDGSMPGGVQPSRGVRGGPGHTDHRAGCRRRGRVPGEGADGGVGVPRRSRAWCWPEVANSPASGPGGSSFPAKICWMRSSAR